MASVTSGMYLFSARDDMRSETKGTHLSFIHFCLYHWRAELKE